MPRRPRPDAEPEILLPDVREPERQANEAIGDEFRARVRRADDRLVVDGWTNIFDRIDETFDFIRRNGGTIDEGLVFFMMRKCAMAAATPVRDDNNQPLLRDGSIVHRLRRVGCRVYMSQEEIGRQFGRSRQHVNEQIGRMKEHGLIVNQGGSWYEFDARLCWRGDFKIQKAYREIQTVRDGLVITDGTTTLVTEDMDADGSGAGAGLEHSPQRVEEEDGS